MSVAKLGSLTAFAMLSCACTAIVAAELSKTDSYAAKIPPNPCSLTDNEDAGPAAAACVSCIAQNCAADVAYACNADGGQPQQWFSTLQKCAENPVESSSFSLDYSCGSYQSGDHTPISDMGSPAEHQRTSEICVYNNCLSQPVPPCHQCQIQINKTNTSDESALADTPCGQCIIEACAATLVRCCSELPSGFTACAYTADKTNQKTCAGLYDAGAPPPDSGTFNRANCEYDVQTQCLTPKCQAICGTGE